MSMNLAAGLLMPTVTRGVAVGKTFCRIVQETDLDVFPSNYGNEEPLRKAASPANVDEMLKDAWGKGVFFLWKNHKSKLHGLWNYHSPKSTFKHSHLFCYGQTEPKMARSLREIFRLLSRHIEIDFGYVHSRSEAETKSYLENNYSALEPFNSGVQTRDLKQGVPNLGWVTLFGKPYVDLIGLDRLMGCPAYRVEKWSEQLVEIQITERVEELERDYESFELARDKVKRFLGMSFFVSANASSAVTPCFQERG
jgi:hypothetical protein